MSIDVDHGVKVNGDVVYSLLSGQSEVQSSGVYASPPEVFGGLALWLSLRASGFCSLFAEGQIADRGIVSYFIMNHGGWKICYTFGLLGDEGLCVFERPPKPDFSAEQPDGPQPSELFIRGFGRGTELARLLIAQVKAWDAAGRPSGKGLRIRIYPKDTDYVPSTDEYFIDKRWTKLVLDWE
ncbi:MAG: hypothetical protein HWN69_09580 [Desulfobacterales bacterium]|nr:hypothetical protein [Desulfobacterales bacterium]